MLEDWDWIWLVPIRSSLWSTTGTQWRTYKYVTTNLLNLSPPPLYIPIFTNFAQVLFLVDAISCLFLIASIIFLGHGPSSSYWTEEGCKRVQIDYTGNTRGKDYGVGFKAALFKSYSTVQIGLFFTLHSRREASFFKPFRYPEIGLTLTLVKFFPKAGDAWKVSFSNVFPLFF